MIQVGGVPWGEPGFHQRLNKINDLMHSLSLFSKVILISVITSGCTSSVGPLMVEKGPLNVAELNLFNETHAIIRPDPSMEEIVLSMSFLQRNDPFEMMRYWVSQGFKGEWKGDTWIDLFEGDGDCAPIAIEKVVNTSPLRVKVIVWTRKHVADGGSPFDAPFVRHEYFLQLEKDGWRRIQIVEKTMNQPGDRIYPYDHRLRKR